MSAFSPIYIGTVEWCSKNPKKLNKHCLFPEITTQFLKKTYRPCCEQFSIGTTAYSFYQTTPTNCIPVQTKALQVKGKICVFEFWVNCLFNNSKDNISFETKFL